MYHSSHGNKHCKHIKLFALLCIRILFSMVEVSLLTYLIRHLHLLNPGHQMLRNTHHHYLASQHHLCKSLIKILCHPSLDHLMLHSTLHHLASSHHHCHSHLYKSLIMPQIMYVLNLPVSG